MVFLLRQWRRQDAKSIANYANNKKIADNLRNIFPYPYTEEDAKGYIARCLNCNENRDMVRAIDVNGEAIGSIGLFIKDDVNCKCAEIGYWLGEPFWGKGIMHCAVDEMCNIAFRRYDLERIYAEVFSYNIASCKVLEHAGFILEGVLRRSVYKNGQIFDTCLYARLKS